MQIIYNRSISFKVLFLKPYINDAIIENNLQPIKYYVSYVDINGLCHSVAILLEIQVMPHKCHVRWLRFHFKRMLIMGLGQ